MLNNYSGILGFLAKRRALTLLLLMLFLAAIMSISYPGTYLSLGNLGVILLNMSVDALVLVAITLLLIMGEIDLSLGAMLLLGGILCGRLMIVHDLPMLPSILIPVLVAMVLGAINGFVVAKLGVISFIGTMATSAIYLGAAVMLGGTGLAGFPSKLFVAMGQDVLFGFIQMPVVYAVIVIGIFAILVNKNAFFRRLYFIGGNLKAAQLSGIKILKSKIVVFMIAAVLATLAGIITAMRFDAASTKVGIGIELKAVTAAVIGGVSFAGGTGTVLGAAMGALFVAFLNNALTIAKVSPDLQYVVIGAVLIIAIIIDNTISRVKK